MSSPANNWRAKLRGHYSCLHCKHIRQGLGRWCDVHLHDPEPGNSMNTQYCDRFSYKENAFDDKTPPPAEK